MAGKLLVVLTLIANIASAFIYFRTAQKEPADNKKDNKALARSLYYISVIFLTGASAFLFYLFIANQFQFSYVFRYSSRDLPLGLLISSFWAGQEGSFLLWTLLIGWLGIFYIRTAKNLENWGMVFVNIVQIFFLVMLVQASPFALLDRVPPDGSGLNALLQNFWMIIHPPVLFVGYAAATFPFAHSLAALVRNDFKNWAKNMIPWILFISITLGAGIIIGGFWSYETLGWGGYWAWDPVENASLIPWLIIIALFHSLLIENKTGALKKTNQFLTILAFLLIIYATFLTRSGVLEDFSVHSFQDLGINSMLIWFQLIILIGGFGLFFIKSEQLKGSPINFSLVNKENVVFLSMWLFIASATLTFLGTSSPIITGFFGDASQVDISFYNSVNLPIALGMALLLGVAPMLKWEEKNNKDILKRLVIPLNLAALAVVLAVVLEIYSTMVLIFIFLASMTIWSNLIIFLRKIKSNWKTSGASLSHIGLGLMFIGIIISGHFDYAERVILEEDQTETVFDYNLTYKGFIEKPDGKNYVEIEVAGKKQEYTARPRIYFSRINQGIMREPHIKAGFFSDIYIAPLERKEADNPGLTLHKGEAARIGELLVRFVSFEMGQHSDLESFVIGANLEFENNGEIVTATPKIVMNQGERVIVPAEINLNSDQYKQNPEVRMVNLNADHKSIALMFDGIPGLQYQKGGQLLIEISKKPFMSILWIGTVLLTVGTIIAFIRRNSLNDTEETED